MVSSNIHLLAADGITLLLNLKISISSITGNTSLLYDIIFYDNHITLIFVSLKWKHTQIYDISTLITLIKTCFFFAVLSRKKEKNMMSILSTQTFYTLSSAFAYFKVRNDFSPIWTTLIFQYHSFYSICLCIYYI